MDQTQDEIELAASLNLAMRSLIAELNKNTVLAQFATQLHRKKDNDRRQQIYIENERMKKELGNQYESSDSDGAESVTPKEKVDRKVEIKKQLIECNFDPSILSDITVPVDRKELSKQNSINDLIQEEEGKFKNSHQESFGLNVIKEMVSGIELEDEEERKTNFGLEFLILKLEEIQNAKKIM